jgi:uncharacterized glyoxalase superfamily protein PhnB
VSLSIHQTYFILFVQDQEISKDFYEKIFRKKADIHVVGMTEFIFSESCTLGLMPTKGVAKILEDDRILDVQPDIPRCELYFYVDDVEREIQNALAAGAVLKNSPTERIWGDFAGYIADPDGHIVGFAKKIKKVVV